MNLVKICFTHFLSSPEYQAIAIQFDTAKEPENYQERYNGFMEKALGLAGETGEVIEKIKKMIRDKDVVFPLTFEEQVDLEKELGDVLWYVSAIAYYSGIELGDIATANLNKLEDRRERNKIHGSGDNR